MFNNYGILKKIAFWMIKIKKWYNLFFNAYLFYPTLYYIERLKIQLPENIIEILDKIEPYYFSCLLIFIIVKIILGIIEYKTIPSQMNLLKENKEFKNQQALLANNIREIFKGFLFNLLNQIEKSLEQKYQTYENINSLRISLYFFSNDDFILIERASKNPQLGQRGRPFYPKNEGVIGMAWKDGWKFKTYSSKRINRQYKNDGISDPDSIKMKSLQIGALRLSCYKSSICTPLGLIVVETTKETLLDETKLKILLETNQVYLSNSINVLQNYIPKTNRKEEL